MLQRKALSILFIMLITSTVDAQRKDSLIFRNSRNEFETTYNKISENKVYQMLRVPVPLFVISAITYGQGDKFRTLRNTHVPDFHYRYDDFLQYAPLAAVIGMKLGGVESRSSWPRLLVSDLFAAGIMATAVNSMKYTIKRERPDGSKNNSFPSGHTATAFMAATIMHREYGLTRSPLYSIGGYTIATATAFSRQLNNRHWLSDVLAGAGIGILSAELGYFLADLIFKDKGLNLPDKLRESAPKGGRPSFLEFSVGYSIINGSVEIGKNIRLSSPGATNVSVKGGYFFNPYFGIGGEVTALASPMAFDMSLYTGTTPSTKYNITRVHADPTGIFTFTAGPYFSLPVAGKLLLGTKFQAGYSHLVKNDVEMDLQEKQAPYTTVNNIAFMKGEGSSNYILRTGISATGIVNRNLGIRMFVDYDYTFLKAPYQLLTSLSSDKPTYSESYLSKHKMHYFTIGATGTALFW